MSISQIRLGAVLVGWVTCLSLMFLIVMASIGYLITSETDLTSPNAIRSSIYIDLLLYSTIFVAFLVGGYVAGRMAALAGAINGVMVVATTVVVASFAIIFVTIVDNRLGIDMLSPVLQALSPYVFKIFVAFLFAVTAGVLGGHFGEGYVNRLDLTLNVIKPASRKDKLHKKQIPKSSENKPPAKQQKTKVEPINVRRSDSETKKKKQAG